MANQPTKYRKFVVGAASAALVASAVAPVASAKDFSDTKGNTHEAAIDALSDAGIINGYEDGTFKPNKTLTRSDVVKMMGKWLVAEGYEVPSDYKTNPRFTDLTSATNDELLKYAAVVKDNGVFNGSNGRLLAGDNMSRENMAVVLVRAFDTVKDINLVEYVQGNDYKKEVTDLNSAKSEARPAIEVLDFFDVTTVAQFNPKGTTTRGHFATFLNNFLNADLSKVTGVVAGVESITAVNNTTVEVKFVEAVEDLAALNFKIDGLDITNKVIKQTDAKTVVLTTAVQEGGKVYTVTANDKKLGTFSGVSAVVPTGVTVVDRSQQGVVGKDVTVTASVTVPEGQSKAGIPVTFNVTSSEVAGALQNGKLEAVAYTDDKGVASYTYTRYYAHDDNVVAYATHKSSVSSSAKVYWANAIQLAVSEITTGNDLANDTKKTYKVTGAPNSTYYVAIKENLNVTPDNITDVKVQDHTTGNYVTPVELSTSSAGNVYASVVTNSAGEGSFTIYGAGLEATPIVYDPTTVSATSKMYSPLALQAKAPTVKFSKVENLAIDVVAEGTANAAEYAQVPVKFDSNSAGGRTYTVTVTDKSGKALAPEGTKAYVYLAVSGDVYFSTGTKDFEKVADETVKEITVGKDGKAQFRVAGKGATTYVQPTVFLNTAGSTTVPALNAGDISKKAEVTYFKSAVVTNAVLSVKDKFGRDVTSVSAGEEAFFTYQSVDQNGFPYRSTRVTSAPTTQLVWVPVIVDGQIVRFEQQYLPVAGEVATEYTLAFDVTSTFGHVTVKNAAGTVLNPSQNLGNTKTYQVKSDAEGKAIVRVTSTGSDTVTVNVTGASNILPTKSATVSFVDSAIVPDIYSGNVYSFNSLAGTLTFAGGKNPVSLVGTNVKYSKGNETIATYDAFIDLLRNAEGTVSVTRTVANGVTTFNIYNMATTGAKPIDVAAGAIDAADTVKAQIAALPTVENLKVSDENAVKAARTAYNALSADQKTLVGTDVEKLVAVEQQIVALKADEDAPEVTNAAYTLNGESINLDNVDGGFTIAIPATDDNTLSNLQFTLNEDHTVYVTGTSDIASINVNNLLKVNKLDKLVPENGVITLDLNSIANQFNGLDFTSNAGQKKYIELTLTDAAGNAETVRINLDFVAPAAE